MSSSRTNRNPHKKKDITKITPSGFGPRTSHTRTSPPSNPKLEDAFLPPNAPTALKPFVQLDWNLIKTVKQPDPPYIPPTEPQPVRLIKRIAMKTHKSIYLIALMGLLSLTGCETTHRELGLKVLGYKVATEVVEHHAENAEVVTYAALAIGDLMEEESIAFNLLEGWYEKQMKALALHPIEEEVVRSIVEPFYREIKAKHGGTILDISNPQVRLDLIAFKRGLELGLET